MGAESSRAGSVPTDAQPEWRDLTRELGGPSISPFPEKERHTP